MSLDDEDVHQYLPVAVSYYEAGVSYSEQRILVISLMGPFSKK